MFGYFSASDHINFVASGQLNVIYPIVIFLSIFAYLSIYSNTYHSYPYFQCIRIISFKSDYFLGPKSAHI